MEPFSFSRQTTPVQNPIQHAQTQNYGEQGNQQNPALINHTETASKLWGNKPVQIDHHETGLQHKNVPHYQIYYQKTASRDRTNQETNIPQQQVQNVQEKKITKTQATQVNEINEGKKYYNRDAPSRPDHQRSVEEEYLRKEPFFINHYYSHLVGQCCCQQQGIMVRRGETMVQSSVGPTCEKGGNSQKSLKSNEVKACNGATVMLSEDVGDEQEARMLHCRTRGPVVEPKI